MSLAFQQAFITSNGDTVELVAGAGDWINIVIVPVSGGQPAQANLSKSDSMNLLMLLSLLGQAKANDVKVDAQGVVQAPVNATLTPMKPSGVR